jgi:hypothetical protein
LIGYEQGQILHKFLERKFNEMAFGTQGKYQTQEPESEEKRSTSEEQKTQDM